MGDRVSMEMNKTKYSFYNAFAAIVLTLVNGILGIVVTRLVIGRYGSDFNGLNSTANQIINVLLILEGGFSLATNVALFSPINSGDYLLANGILRATNRKFRKIGILFFAVGLLVSFIYCIAVKSNLSREFVFTVIVMAVVPQAVNLFFATTYRVLLQTQQKEYIISFFTAFTIGAGHIVNIFIINNNGAMWMIRFVTMAFALINCALIISYTKRKNRFINFNQPERSDLIKGTNDVLAQKITGVIYTSWPIVFLSISSNGGTMLASVYSVYNSVFVMVKALLHAAIDAPRLSFGAMLTEKTKNEIWPVYKQYEFITIAFTFVAMTTATALIMPFIQIYTIGFEDINYYDKIIAVLMILITSVEMIHIPSGHLINMSGNFKASKNFQIIACIVLIISMFAFGSFWGVYGMLAALLLVAVLLALMEIGFVHTTFFTNKSNEYLKMFCPLCIIGVVISFIEMKLTISVDGYIALLLYAFGFFIINTMVCLFVCYFTDNKATKEIIKRVLVVLKGIAEKRLA